MSLEAFLSLCKGFLISICSGFDFINVIVFVSYFLGVYDIEFRSFSSFLFTFVTMGFWHMGMCTDMDI